MDAVLELNRITLNRGRSPWHNCPLNSASIRRLVGEVFYTATSSAARMGQFAHSRVDASEDSPDDQ